jgi:hypothetical protein
MSRRYEQRRLCQTDNGTAWIVKCWLDGTAKAIRVEGNIQLLEMYFCTGLFYIVVCMETQLGHMGGEHLVISLRVRKVNSSLNDIPLN